jgi:hypothetical protein
MMMMVVADGAIADWPVKYCMDMKSCSSQI